MEELPRGTLTFLFTDIEGSTRLLRQLRDRYNAVLADHRRILRSAFQRHGGEEIGTEGDSFFVVFRSARDAVAAAAEGQRALAAHEWPDDAPIRVRMGMNTGEPAVDDDGSYVGLGVHLAARIASAGHGGQVLLSQATCALLQADEAELGVDVHDLGDHWLKDFDRPERIFQLVGDGLPDAFPALKTLDKQAVDATAREGGLPYKGLEAFQPQDAEFFFGREELVASLAARLADARFLAVIGPSGSGKSSVVRAGVIPAIWRDGPDWRVILFTPGAEPLDELAVHLAAEQGVTAGSLLADLRADPGNLCLSTRQLMLDRPAGACVALVVDQFEEVFTLCRREEDRRAFVEAIVRAAESDSSRAVVVLSLRADFYGHCASHPELAALLERSQAIVGPMRERELRRAIERPAAAAGVQLEPGLADEILADLGDEPGNLPLLSHALLETWKRRAGKRLTIADYREAGGVREAIARTADAVYASLSPEQREIARRVFLRLAEPGQGTEDTRRRAGIDELLPDGDEGEAAEVVLETLARERLITIGQGTVEVAHEALIREWPQFRRWLDEDREGLQIHRRLTEEAREWERLGRDASVLYRGARLQAAREWSGAREAELSALEREFLDACGEAELTELEAARSRNRRLRLLAGSLAALLVLALIAAVVALVQTRRADAQRRLATSRGLVQAAAAQLDERVDLALLLAVEAHAADATFETRDALLRGLQRGRRIAQFVPAGAPVRDVAVSVGGRTIAAVGANGLGLWDARTRRRLPGFAGRVQPRAVVAIAPNGRMLVTDAGEAGLALWDLTARRLVRTVPMGLPTDVEVSPDGATIAAATGDGVVLLDSGGQRRGAPLTRGGDPALHVAFAPDGNVVAASSLDGTITLWDVASGTPSRGPLRAEGVVESLAFGVDGRTLVAAADDLLVWDFDEPSAPPRRLASSPQAAAVSASGVVAAAEPDGSLLLWDLRAGAARDRALGGHHKPVTSMTFGPGGVLVTAGEDGNVIVWDTGRDPHALRLRADGEPVPGVAVAASDRVVAAAGSEVLIWGRGPRPSRRVAIGMTVVDVAAGADGRLLAGTTDGRVATGEVDDVAGAAARTVGTGPVSVDVAGERFAAASDRAVVWSANDTRVRPLPGGGSLQDIAFSPDGKTVAVAATDGVRLYDARSRRARGVRVAPNEPVRRVAFSPDGEMLATVGEDVDVELWNADTGAPAGSLASATAVGSIAFSPDGRLAAAGTLSGTVAIWDVATRRALGEPIPGHSQAVLDVAFGADGGTLASGGSDGAVLLHDVSPWSDDATLSERACAVAGRNLTRAEWETFLPGEQYGRTCARWPEAPAT